MVKGMKISTKDVGFGPFLKRQPNSLVGHVLQANFIEATSGSIRATKNISVKHPEQKIQSFPTS